MREQKKEIFCDLKKRKEKIDISQINMEEMTRRYGEEETVRMMREIMENNMTMIKLQK